MDQEHLTHKETENDLREIKQKLDDLQNQIDRFKKQYLAHIDKDNINLE